MNLMSPSKKVQSHGVQLTRFLEKEWDALYTTRGAWCRANGLADSTVYRWSQGVEPDLRNMQTVADGLNRRLVDILFAAGYLDESDVRVRTVTPPRERIELEAAIRTDPELTDSEREALLAVHAAFQGPSTRSGKRSVRVTRKG